jgi:hypothetical protein
MPRTRGIHQLAQVADGGVVDKAVLLDAGHFEDCGSQRMPWFDRRWMVNTRGEVSA